MVAGYVPRRLYRYGGTYKEDCDDCIDEHISNVSLHQRKMGSLRATVQANGRLAPMRDRRDTKSQLSLIHSRLANQPFLRGQPVP